jgi:ABC-2 type transport system ATP-binding protein
VLEIDSLSKRYGQVAALDGASFVANRGRLVGFLGPNGAGKTTTMRCVFGLATPDSGEVRGDGRSVDPAARLRFGYMPEQRGLYPRMRVAEQLAYFGQHHGLSGRDARSRAAAWLERFGLTDRAKSKLEDLSHGNQQRVQLATALVHDPELLVLDEPLSGIDPVGRQEMLEVFRTLVAQGKCLLISSHELEELEKLTNHVAVMARGRIAAVGTLQQIRDLMDDFPLSVRVDVDRPRDLARRLLDASDVIGCDVGGEEGSVVVRATHPRRFYEAFGRLVVEEMIEVRRLEPLDDTAHAILGYLLGGSGKT